jgi:hypothetical protein
VEDGRPSRIQILFGTLGMGLIRLYLRLFGRTVRKADVPWLVGPIGPEGPIGDRPYHLVAEREGLTIDRGATDAGLVPDFAVLAGPTFDAAKTDPEVRRFYERTSSYELDVWSETRFPGRLFLWLIVATVSRYMNQLNFPVFGLETSRGMTSEVLPLRDAAGRAVHTGWRRRLLGSGRTIYTGFYTTVQPPRHGSACVKVVFPVPRGNATVLLRPEHDEAGRFRLVSVGRGFGDAGFYRVLALDDERLKVRYLKTLHERFAVYTDEEGVLRCDHEVRFLGIPMLRLHYRMRAIVTPAAAAAPA